MIGTTPKSFSKNIKQIIWPIERHELKLFVPMALMMLCILFNFGSLRSVKDSLVVPEMGAEVISFLKLWLVLPSSIIFTLIYVKLSNSLNAEYIFYIIVTVFLSFFLLFAYVIYPNQHIFHPSSQNIQNLIANYSNFKWFIIIAGKWSYVLMYIFGELWSAVVINLMFWQFANHIFDTSKAKRFYPILGMIGNMGLILAGNMLISFSDFSGDATENLTHSCKCQAMLQPIILTIVVSGLLSMVLFKIINFIILNDDSFKKDYARASEETKTQLSLKQSFKLIIKSKYIGHIVLLILCYGLLINILEGPWKAKVRELYPNTIDYMNFMGRFNIWMGIFSVSFMIIGGNILRACSWLFSASLTPLMIAITGFAFFMFVIFAKEAQEWGYSFNPIYAAVIIGAAQNILSKSTKYSLFDSTKEMAYIPLSVELRTKGKAAVEVIGTKFGKSMGAFIQSTMFMLVPSATFDSITIYLMTIFAFVIIIWFWNVIKLNNEYLKIQQ